MGPITIMDTLPEKNCISGHQKNNIITACLIAFLFLIFSSFPAHANDASINLIKSVIKQQLKAFNEDDYHAAYRFASKNIQTGFSLREFETMVRRGFPEIAKSLKVSFDEISMSEDGTQAIAIVYVTGKARTTVIAQYLMVLEDGNWKNNGVMNLKRITPI